MSYEKFRKLNSYVAGSYDKGEDFERIKLLKLINYQNKKVHIDFFI